MALGRSLHRWSGVGSRIRNLIRVTYRVKSDRGSEAAGSEEDAVALGVLSEAVAEAVACDAAESTAVVEVASVAAAAVVACATAVAVTWVVTVLPPSTTTSGDEEHCVCLLPGVLLSLVLFSV